MNNKIEKILEFGKIKAQLASYAVTKQGIDRIEKMKVLTKREKVQIQLEETEDGMKLLRTTGGIPVAVIENIQPHIKRLEIGANLNGVELAQIAKMLRVSTEIARFFEEQKEKEVELFHLYDWAEKLVYHPEINRTLRQSVDEDGRILDEASVELTQIRRQILRTEGEIRTTLGELIRGKNAKYLSDTIITQRSDRYVIPVKQEYKNVFGGVVHDSSASGQTVFVEPRAVLDLNNRLRQAQLAQRQEIERILAELSALLAPHTRELSNNSYVVSHMDIIEAKARLAKEMKAIVPKINEENHVSLFSARHPLIDKKQVVANDLLLGKDFQAMVITGPNTGGKTITMKSLGLLQLMAQAGLAIPVAEESEIGIFTEIFADIGDEQSIEQSLSTFSSHMTNIVDILRKMDKNSLILFDELGAGTDPQEGSALAIAILDKVQAVGAYVVASTHYPELKVYGYNRIGVINASMEFDVESLKPTYRLLIGVPGRSNAFDISARLGLSGEIIQSAKDLVDEESQNINEMIHDLESRRKMAEQEFFEARANVEEAGGLLAELKEMYHLFVEERERELEKARKQANSLLENSRDEAEKIISDLREKQKSIGKVQIKEHELIEAKGAIDRLQHEEVLAKNKVLKRAKKAKKLQSGDEVLVESYGQRGNLIRQNKDGSWQVQVGILKMNISENEMTPVAKEKQETTTFTKVRSDVGTARKSVSSQLDLRGERYENALVELDSYLDSAILAGYPQVTIIHGKGTGALREGVWSALKNHRSVKKFEYAPASSGGNGATIVEFK
ncbi:DNA mismatch repair protein MutS2 [Pilibacter termitis]|uniref:Endonuclease MutS2 n=1 Tax=Pilibacter termitis TaxID=263852 RepID=A0A1T4KGM6_9ENTE|nr:endonuclease MutS2 [Pilibacter termitis]SJZ41570.1 DNA mismatch repair protein MutS2 [Pilibacter termitis]